MKIIISPAKKMNVDEETLRYEALPDFLEDTEILLDWMRTLSFEESRKLWSCSDKLAELNFQRLRQMNLREGLTPALLSYEGIQYQYMAPAVFSDREWSYVQEHLRILSGFYGVLRPLDGVTPYRLEMQAKARAAGAKDLYQFWNRRLYDKVTEDDRTVLNLASREYSRCVENYAENMDRVVTCVFGEWKNGKVIQKGTQAKMARGEMVRYMAENQIENPEEVKAFRRLGYQFRQELSTEKEYVFMKEGKEKPELWEQP